MENKNEFTIERTFDAPIEKVWQSWTDPELLKQWWGPDNVTIPECEVDLKVGGKFYIVMEAGEAMGPYKGTLWPMMATFTTVEPTSKLAYEALAWTEGAKEETTIEQTTDVSFSEQDGKTVVKVTAIIHKAGPKAGGAVQGMAMGFTQQMEKFGKFLHESKS
jgi:uncharacterized protein YndB with AHSA1/START domain